MKTKLLLASILLGIYSRGASAQDVVKEALPDDNHGCVTEAQYRTFLMPKLQAGIKIADSIRMANGKAGTQKMMGGTVLLNWPLRMDEEYSNINGVYSYFVVGNYADLNSTEGSREDWMCFTGSQARNYDQHNGADISPYPFGWQMMDDESVDVIAAADGEVIYLEDGYIDRNCDSPHVLGDAADFNGGYYGNFVALQHDDLSITVYAHLKQNTVAALNIGDYIQTGTYLGKIGSSGNSSGPHIHFEYRQCVGCSYSEPWFDPEGCNTDVSESRWVSQLPYDNPQLIRISTHDGTVDYKTCSEYEAGENEDVYIANHFNTGTFMTVRVALRDFLLGDVYDLDIYTSADVLKYSTVVNADEDFRQVVFSHSVWLSGYAAGTYKIRILHNGKYYYHYFTVGCPTAATYSGAVSGVKGFLNGDGITSTSTISGVSSNNILYEAENYVKLNPGFQATQNCSFRAKIDPCTVGGAKEEYPEVIDPDAMTVFPNPGFGLVSVLLPASLTENVTLQLLDQLGKLIYTESITGTTAHSLDLRSFAKGIYHLMAFDENHRYTEAVIIQ